MGQHYNVCQIVFLNPFFRVLEHFNINIERLIRKSNLKYFDLDRSEGYAPLECVYDFYSKSKHQISDGFFKSSVLGFYDLEHLGRFGNYLAKLPTLYSILCQFVLYKSIYQTNLNCNLSIYDRRAKFSFSCADRFSAGRKIGESIFMAVLLQLFRRHTHKHWEPDEIHIPYNSYCEIDTMLIGKNCKFILNQQNFAIVFPRKILYRANSVSIRFSKQLLPSIPDKSISETIEQVLKSYKPGYIPSLSDLAQHFSISESSIKRSLKCENAKFSKILEKILFEKSIDLLTNSNLNITLISEHLGYSDSPNFIRSFKKWSGMTPGKFRKANFLTHNDNGLPSEMLILENRIR